MIYEMVSITGVRCCTLVTADDSNSQLETAAIMLMCYVIIY